MNPKTNLYLFIGITVLGVIVFCQSRTFDLLLSENSSSETNDKGVLPWVVFFIGCIYSIISQIVKLTKKS